LQRLKITTKLATALEVETAELLSVASAQKY
jgi:hypothetical protein